MHEAGLIIWICEGTKFGNDYLVELTNSDVGIITQFLSWLRKKGINENRLKARVQCHPSQLSNTEEFWSTITGIPLNRFTKPILKKGEYKGGKSSVVIRYCSKALLDEIKSDAYNQGFLEYPPH